MIIPAPASSTLSGTTHDDRSKSMYSSTFSCGDRGCIASQPVGGGAAATCPVLHPTIPPGFATPVVQLTPSYEAPPTCSPLKTARPQYCPPPSLSVVAFTGVSKEK